MQGINIIITWTLFILIVITGAFDVWLITTTGYSNSITNYVRTLAKDYPIIPFLIGVIVGHLFWST